MFCEFKCLQEIKRKDTSHKSTVPAGVAEVPEYPGTEKGKVIKAWGKVMDNREQGNGTLQNSKKTWNKFQTT